MKTPYTRFFWSDWIADTSHLDLMQKGAYMSLLEYVYQHSRPLPGDLVKVYRICHATSPTEQQSIRHILEEYFTPFKDVELGQQYRHLRAEREIEWAQSSRQQAVEAGRKGASKRWGKHGDPNGDPNGDPTSDPNSNQNQNQNQNQNHSHNHNQNHEEEILSTESCRAKAATSPKKLPPMEDVEKILEHLNARTGQNFRARNHKREPTKNAQSVRERLAEYDMETCLRVIDKKVADWQGGEMEQYLRPGTLFRREKFEQYAGQVAQPQRQYGDFLNDDDGNTGNVFEGKWSKA